ncbi:hypothetical protein Nepgr_017353 [Nepenthes gracilis]|uniref:Uncharacterized protein n=1 Tax=Nepenthes gracilis TaxID=150966 RepID=A0AAD3SS84_NEPGR|nr:hypothetical protein Nepgr_017353 [Nepenthes gracilis]
MLRKGLLDDSGPKPPSDVAAPAPVADSASLHMNSSEVQTNSLSAWIAVVQNSSISQCAPLKFFPPQSMDRDVVTISPPTDVIQQR